MEWHKEGSSTSPRHSSALWKELACYLPLGASSQAVELEAAAFAQNGMKSSAEGGKFYQLSGNENWGYYYLPWLALGRLLR